MKKNTIAIIFCLLSILYISCSQQVKDEVYPIADVIPLTKNSVYNIQDRSYMDMMILDSLLILIADKDSNFFHVFNKTTMVPLMSFGKKGNAAFEFNKTPRFVKQHYESNDYIDVFELFSIKRINIKNITEGENISGEIESERMDEKLDISREIVSLDSTIFLGVPVNNYDGLFYIFDKKSRNKKWVSYNPKLKIDKEYYESVYYGLIETSPDNETIVYCPRYFDRILFYNKDGELLKTLNFSEVKTPVLSKDFFGVSNDEIIYSIETYRTKSFIYVLRPLQSLNNLIENISPIKVQIMRLTWNGELDATYEIDMRIMPTLFCVDEQNEKIIFNTPTDSYLSNDIITEIAIYDIE